MVKTQLTMRASVPRPEDSGTQPTNACAVGDGLELHPEQEARFIAMTYALRQLLRHRIKEARRRNVYALTKKVNNAHPNRSQLERLIHGP